MAQPEPSQSERLSKREDETYTEFALRQVRAEWTAPLEAQIRWLRNQMGDVRGMQSDGATPEEMDEALGRALRGERAHLAFDEARSAGGTP